MPGKLGWLEGQADLANRARLVDGDGDADLRRDIGAFEYQRQAPDASAQSAKKLVAVRAPLAFKAAGSDLDPGDNVRFAWKFGDGSTGTGAAPSHRYAKPGVYTWTLRAIDLTVEPGTKVAIVGETGSGKTTLGYLAARLYDPERGAVRLDGVDLRELTFASLAGAVGVVSQETYLFHASVRENLRFARADATDEEIEEAARAAQVHDTIAALPEGYDTVVGERGFRFSGGERQRIAIARTILRNPPVLILDEATSALDVQTERAVGEALDELAEGRTTLVIAHRLSTVREADQIAVLDHGRVVERGTHEELLALGGRYADLVARDSGPLSLSYLR
jgi:ATP-binding cassette subfamily B protein